MFSPANVSKPFVYSLKKVGLSRSSWGKGARWRTSWTNCRKRILSVSWGDQCPRRGEVYKFIVLHSEIIIRHRSADARTKRLVYLPDRLSMFQQNLNACMKYIQKYDPLRYDRMTDAASNFLGFRLRVVEACDSMHDDTKVNMTMTSTNLDDDTLRLHYSPITVPFSPEQHENSCDSWLQSDTSDLLPVSVQTSAVNFN